MNSCELILVDESLLTKGSPVKEKQQSTMTKISGEYVVVFALIFMTVNFFMGAFQSYTVLNF